MHPFWVHFLCVYDSKLAMDHYSKPETLDAHNSQLPWGFWGSPNQSMTLKKLETYQIEKKRAHMFYQIPVRGFHKGAFQWILIILQYK